MTGPEGSSTGATHPDRPVRTRSGRPRDPEATRRALEATRAILASGTTDLTADRVAEWAGVGKATVYRRWTGVADLVVDAVAATDPLPASTRTDGDAAERLTDLLDPLTAPLSPPERTIAAAMAMAAGNHPLQDALRAVLLDPLRERIRATVTDVGTPGRPAGTRDAAVALVESLWLRRFVFGAVPRTETEIQQLVAFVLVPLLAPDAAAGTPVS